MAAAEGGRLGALRHFLKDPKAVEEKDFFGPAPFWVVERPSIGWRRGWTALHHACHMGRHSSVELLLRHKADMEQKNDDGGGAGWCFWVSSTTAWCAMTGGTDTTCA